MTFESTMSSEEMIIRTREEWEAVLSRGAVVEYDTKLCKIFRMPDGTRWRVLPKWRRAWRVRQDSDRIEITI
jgi:hypothetical protein